jgi:AraC family transcriptional regulator of adaptative response / DNA-3-methyladenine glycosylase II
MGKTSLSDPDHLLERFYARDRSWDGKFFVGVTSTGIYCLPSCPARKPHRRNVRLFADRDSAESEGFRPCLRCRPDHFSAGFDPALERLEAAVGRMRGEPGQFHDVADLATAAGVSRSSLHELVRVHYHASPATLLRRARVDLAARRLLLSRASMLDIAEEAGFESSSTFHANFRDVLGMTPGDYRRLSRDDRWTIALPRRFRAGDVARMAGRDPLSPCDRADGLTVWKRLRSDRGPVELRLDFDGTNATVSAAAKHRLSSDERAALHASVMTLCGFSTETDSFERRAASDAEVFRLLGDRRGVRIPGTATLFEAIAWSIIGQQVNLAFAFKLRRAMIEACAAVNGGDQAHPTADDVAALDYADLTSRQFSSRKAEYLIDTARLIAGGTLELETLRESSATTARKSLLAVRGIGEWSANYIMLRGLGLNDCVPIGDSALRSSLRRFFALEEPPDADAVGRLMRPFAPHRSLATFHLWMSGGEPA